MGADQQYPRLCIQRLQCDQALSAQPRELRLVMHYGTERIQNPALCKQFFRTVYGPDHTPAETGIPIYFNSHQHRMPNLPWIRPWIHTSSS